MNYLVIFLTVFFCWLYTISIYSFQALGIFHVRFYMSIAITLLVPNGLVLIAFLNVIRYRSMDHTETSRSEYASI